MINALSIEDLSFTYQSWTEKENDPLFRGLSLSLPAGSKTLLLAPFNKGKTTLAKIICGVCPKYFPGELQGDINLYGKSLSDLDPWDLLPVCTYVSQNPQEQFVATSVEEEIAFPLESMGMERETMHARIEEAITQWGLQDLRTSSEQELSGGERKRVLLATMQAIDASFWLLDEAFDDLDQHWRDQLKHLIATKDKTVLVLASRYLREFDDLFYQVLLLDEGDIASGDRSTLISRFAHLCGDDLPNPLETEHIQPSQKRILSCKSLQAERSRVSTTKSKQFTLEVPDFQLQSGELVTLVGPNGSGKSSFSRLLCGLDTPIAGQITIDGEPFKDKQLSKRVGYLFQSPDLQIFLPTVAEELSWSLKRRSDLSKSEIESRIATCAELFSLDLEDTPTTMSYPLRKALQAAVYYLLDRPFYILDELDSALTYQSTLSIIAHLRRNGAGILLITHDRQFADKVAQRSYTIKEGRLIAV
ncbi:ATP-binding cassette domain-containing protein [Sphaerochaeta halotolerans]|uniref:ATP-binding cassette domain-containing protein n=1 Tax=Sphaerochaeta halotolerans TaxID=2293840 RepID=UPI0013692CD4|nr:ABC transporter ATP-binding protein [Sphaerochaeta halotolerans]MXI86433.1 ATP-binding cassette domain-containing protein [Sphaerochaeta halotolerans]